MGYGDEPEARAVYEFMNNVSVDQIGFVDHPVIVMTGASPDGLVGDDGLVEIKCPNTATHINTLQGKAIEKKYNLQMQWQMACCERDWCDFVSFDPRMPAKLQMHVTRVERDGELIEELTKDIGDFLEELNDRESQLRSLMERDAA